jgi:hypothetical protein
MDRTDDARAVSGFRIDLEVAADGFHAVVHVANSASVQGFRCEPRTVVANLEAQPAAGLAELDPDFSGAAGMFERVLERFDTGEVDGALEFGRLARDADRLEMDGAPGALDRASHARADFGGGRTAGGVCPR